MKASLKKMLLSIFYKCYFVYASIVIRLRYSYEYHFGKLTYLDKENYKIWKKAMLGLMKKHCFANYGFGTRLIYNTFAKANIEVIRYSNTYEKNAPIVVLCVKDDKQRLQMLVEHYRKFGIHKFAFLDNGSIDGTFEWMMGQDDIDVFRTCDQYNCLVKEGWLNRIVSYYGLNRWYILTDSDELLTYVGMEEHPFSDLIAYAEKNHVRRFKGINLDMYADAPLFSIDSKDLDIKSRYCWTDSDSYTIEPRKVAGVTITAIHGGPRYRVMGVPCSVMKYPLVYFEPGTVSSNAHFQFPYEIIEQSPCCVGILHYKFLDTDKKEFQRRSQFGTGFDCGFAKTGDYYKQYIKAAEQNITFMYDKSVKYENSASLEKIDLLEKIPF